MLLKGKAPARGQRYERHRQNRTPRPNDKRAGRVSYRFGASRCVDCTRKLLMGAGEPGAGARGHAAGAALGAFVGLVTGDIQFDEGARRDIEFNSATAAIDQRAGSDREAAFLFDDADRFARRAARRPDVLNHEHALAGVQLEATPKRHLAGTVAFNEQCANAQSARDFLSDDDATQGRRYDARDSMIVKNPGQSAAQGFSMLRELQDERALEVCGAVAAARKLEVALANGAYLLEEREDVVAFHFARDDARQSAPPVRVA